MGWRERMQSGSFRGAAFLAESHDAEGGRRLALHEYPLRESPWAEDLGRKAGRWNLELFVLGPDYMPGRDALIAALDAEGPATLVHPWLGSRAVCVDSWRLRESLREGGMARFSVVFVESGAQARPDAGRDTSWAVSQAADGLRTEAAADFPRAFDVGSRPEFVRVSAADSLRQVLDAVRSASALLSGASGVGALLAEVSELEALAASLILAPSTLAFRVRGVAAGLSATAPDRATGYAASRRLLDLAADPATPAIPATPSRAQEAANTAALRALARRSALAEAAAAVAARDFATYDDARAVRDAMADSLDAEAATAPDPVFAALTDLRVAVVRDLAARGASLARLTAWTPGATLPALVVAHQVYGDATRAGEIVARNKVRHPGAVPGGRALEVLTNA